MTSRFLTAAPTLDNSVTHKHCEAKPRTEFSRAVTRSSSCWLRALCLRDGGQVAPQQEHARSAREACGHNDAKLASETAWFAHASDSVPPRFRGVKQTAYWVVFS